MRLTFLGHAAFVIEATGQKIVTDPYSPEIGYQPLQSRASLVTVSHENPKWHSHIESVQGDFTVFNGLENFGQTWDFDGVELQSFPVFESWPNDGEPQGPNSMVKITADNLRLLHMGDVGHALGEDYIEALGEIDILLAPTGDSPTISIADLIDFIERLKPNLVIPMHMGVPHLAMQIEPVGSFLNAWNGSVINEGESKIEISMDDLPRRTTVCVLEPLRLRHTEL